MNQTFGFSKTGEGMYRVLIDGKPSSISVSRVGCKPARWQYRISDDFPWRGGSPFREWAAQTALNDLAELEHDTQ